MPLKRKVLSLGITNACNLDCIYCYESNKDGTKMPLSIAKKAIIEAFSSLPEGEELEIDFFGGEPFLHFSLIKKIVTWVVDELKPGRPYIFFATTNGTLIHGKIKKWLLQNKCIFYCCLSIDGTKKMHNHNRSSSYDSIDVDFFVTTWPHQEIKMTVSMDTLPNLFEGVVFLHEKGFLVQFNLAENVNWSYSSALSMLNEQLLKLAACRN